MFDDLQTAIFQDEELLYTTIKTYPKLKIQSRTVWTIKYDDNYLASAQKLMHNLVTEPKRN